MTWGTIETEPEIDAWLESLTDAEYGQAEYHIDLLERDGPLLGEPDTRQLDGKLRELRFYIGRQQTRVTYYIASGRRIIILTVFPKTKMREAREIARAKRAMQRCMSEGHTAEDD